MLLYNVTIKVNWRIHDAWLQWMLDVHVPEILGTGCFVKHQVLRLLEIDETEGPTYAFQYFTPGKDQYDQYVDGYSEVLRQQTIGVWGDQFIAFRTLMEVIN